MKAVIYARQSGHGAEIDERQEKAVSIETQIENCKWKAQSKGLEIIDIFTDENISGKTYPVGAEDFSKNDEAFMEWCERSKKSKTKRKFYRAGLKEVMDKLPEIDYIICDEMTRFYRPLDLSFLAHYLEKALLKNKVKILTVKEGEIDFGNANFRLIQGIKNSINDAQIEFHRAKSLNSINALKDDGIRPYGADFYGYKRIGKHKFEIIEDEAEQIRKAYEWCEEGIPYTEIIKRMNEMREKCDVRFEIKKDNYIGKPRISSPTLMRILKRPEYTGLTYNSQGGKVEWKGGTAIISRALWDKVQDIVTPKRKGGKHKQGNYALSGLLKCGYCGRNLFIQVSQGFTGKEEKFSRYICKNAIDKRIDDILFCNLTSIRYELHHTHSETKKHNYIKTKDSFLEHLKNTSSLIGNIPEKSDFLGLYEALMPLLVRELIIMLYENIDCKSIEDEVAKLRIKIKGNKDIRDKYLKIVKDGVAYEEVKKYIDETLESDRECKSEIIKLQDKATDFQNLSRSEICSWIDDIQNKQLEDEIYKRLVTKVIDHIDIFTSYIVVYLINGEKFELERYLEKSVSALPQWSMEVTMLTGDRSCKAEIIYYYKSFFSKTDYDDEEKTIYEDKTLSIKTKGRNPRPGAMHTSRGVIKGRVTNARYKGWEADQQRRGINPDLKSSEEDTHLKNKRNEYLKNYKKKKKNK